MDLAATPPPGEDTLKFDFCEQFDPRKPGAAKGAACARAAPSIAAFDRCFQHVLAARPQLCTASKVPRVLSLCVASRLAFGGAHGDSCRWSVAKSESVIEVF